MKKNSVAEDKRRAKEVPSVFLQQNPDFRSLKDLQQSGQSSSGHRTSVDLSERLVPTTTPNPIRKSTSYVGMPSTVGSGAVGGVGELSHSYR